MKRIIYPIGFFLTLLFLSFPLMAQEEGDEDDFGGEDFDFSSLVPAEDVKAFCSSRILGGGPQQLVSIGYDIQAPYNMEAGSIPGANGQNFQVDGVSRQVNRTSEFRIDIQYPVVSKNNITIGLQANYLRTFYSFENAVTNGAHPFVQRTNQYKFFHCNFQAAEYQKLYDFSGRRCPQW